ncbi:PolC-type DNA polymerase III [Thermoclostridium stercorarium]|uniref:PolC-type DNA polymerase III n=1 Tax=Thermoclostridium stercorarium TaxID=1510 RepID=UPI0022494DBE|nr:PolC-type DNA polymerase III [Thermoclostridium stercorarium]UZQ86254.1 PolC-type DNA polymerase III [Thermoclostridium stercorarium]
MGYALEKPQKFCDMFDEVPLDENLSENFRNALVSRLLYIKSSGQVQICLELPCYVKMEDICSLEKKLTRFFNTPVAVIPCFNFENNGSDFIECCRDFILHAITAKSKHYGVLMTDAELELDGSRLKIYLKTPSAAILKSGKCDRYLENYIKTCFNRNFVVEFVDPPVDENFNEQILKRQAELEKETIRKIMSMAPEARGGENKEADTGKQKNSDLVFGKNFDTADIVKMSDITIDSGRITVRGKVIRVETRQLNSGKKLFCFDITDLTNSITVKCFADDKQLSALEENVKTGEWFYVHGDIQYDTFSREMTMMTRGILKTVVRERTDNATEKRVELHAHTQMSQMDAVTPVKDLIERAAKWGHSAIAITDHGVVQAYPDAYEAAKKTGIKVIYGVEIYLLGEDKTDPDGNIDYKNVETYHAILLVKNQKGLKNLYKLISESHLNYFYKRPRVPKSVLEKYREGLILGSACEAGEIYRAILSKKDEEELLKIASYYDYLEIQPLGNNRFLIDSGHVSGYDELKEINMKIVELAHRLNKPVVATCDVHFLDKEDEVFRRILQAGQGYSDAERQAPLFLRTTEEMLEEFAYLGEETAYEVVVKNTRLVSEWVETVQPIPDGTYPPYIEGAEEDIKRMSIEKAVSLYGSPLPEIVQKRMDKELNSIIKNGFSVMYIIAQKLVSKSLSDGYLVGSRGSVGSSFVAYLIGITEVNSLPAHYRCGNCLYSEFHDQDKSVGCGFDLPDKNCPRCGKPLIKDGYDIPFETFLGFDGDKEPDIDLNFSGEYQPVAHKYTEELFGVGHVFRAGTIATVAEKTAYGFVKGYLNERGKAVTNAELNRLVAGCTGIKRTTGQHPGGVMIVPHDKEIYDFTPVQRPADDPEADVITTHFDYHSISGRILKLDILGHDDPTVIRMLQDLTGINPKEIPIGERRTMELFRSTEPLGVSPEEIGSPVGTFGIPEFGTRFVRQMLVETKPKTFAELIRISGLSHGTDVWANNAQDLIRNGIATLADVVSTRDDIMLYLIKKGLEPLTAFKIMEDVRKGKGLKPEYEEQMKKHGVPDWYIESCKKIKYMFPKAHAAAYVMMAFRIAWFKVYYPEAFYVTYFTVRADEFDADIISRGQDRVRYEIEELEKKGNAMTQKEKNLLTILEVANEMYARGIKCLPVDLYESDATKFKITEKGILPSLNALQGLGTAAAASIVEARKQGKFLSIDDLKIRTGVSKSVIEILERHGCLNGMEQSNQVCFL